MIAYFREIKDRFGLSDKTLAVRSGSYINRIKHLLYIKKDKNLTIEDLKLLGDSLHTRVKIILETPKINTKKEFEL